MIPWHQCPTAIHNHRVPQNRRFGPHLLMNKSVVLRLAVGCGRQQSEFRGALTADTSLMNHLRNIGIAQKLLGVLMQLSMPWTVFLIMFFCLTFFVQQFCFSLLFQSNNSLQLNIIGTDHLKSCVVSSRNSKSIKAFYQGSALDWDILKGFTIAHHSTCMFRTRLRALNTVDLHSMDIYEDISLITPMQCHIDYCIASYCVFLHQYFKQFILQLLEAKANEVHHDKNRFSPTLLTYCVSIYLNQTEIKDNV